MLIPFSDLECYLRAPGASSIRLTTCRMNGRAHLAATYPGDTSPVVFPVVADQHVLIDFINSIAAPGWFDSPAVSHSPVPRRGQWARTMKGSLLGTASLSARNIRRFRGCLPTDSPPLVLMVGAATKGIGTEILYEDPAIRQVAFDIYPSGLTHFVADAHTIPLADGCVDAVCIQGVLEHVVDPARVGAEIERVLKTDGVVYAETSFMQQVHEGAYDFTRFTELGHRWLWRHFTTIARGPLGGPGLSLYWSAKYFLRGLVRSRRAADILSMPFGVLALADHVMTTEDLIDGASGAFFLGRKRADAVGLDAIALEYLGAQRSAR